LYHDEKIEKIQLDRLRNEEWFQFHSDFKNLMAKNMPEGMGMDEESTRYLALHGEAAAMIDRMRKSAFTVKISEADELRDMAFKGFRTVVKGMLNHVEAEKREAAARLTPVFDHYGAVDRMNYSQETAAAGALLRDMNGTYAGDVVALGLDTWVKGLEKCNNDFTALLNERDTEQGGQPSVRMLSLRKEADAGYQDLISRIEAVALLMKNHPLTPFIDTWNAVVVRYKNMLAQRAGRNSPNHDLQE
jgi:hypothetical protein